ncbi:unnamed protein product [Owenia fusiformis]|uniref:Longin domain-containing protein n=1 Tax=Owenia fusiformis TaxID=6347 RepID=A0A8S4P4N6_OWEFU|nr:unnamed protein product [Owenia fusiformis]
MSCGLIYGTIFHQATLLRGAESVIIGYTKHSVAQDGLPLSASTDFDDRPGFRESQRLAKVLSKNLERFSDRCTLVTEENFDIHYITSLGLCFMTVCEGSYPSVLAFSFLEEIQREFIMTYDHTEVQTLVRPYTYIDFDSFMQKTKQKYSNPHSMVTRLNLNDMNTEIKLRPPYKIQMVDMWPLLQNGMSPQPTTNYGAVLPNRGQPSQNTSRMSALQRVVPVDWLGAMSIVLSLLCTALNLVRGLGVINQGYMEYVEASGFSFGLCFILASVACVVQIYILVYKPIKYPLQKNIGTFVVLVLCNLYVWGLRNIWQILFHIAVAGLSLFYATKHRPEQKLPGYNV